MFTPELTKGTKMRFYIGTDNGKVIVDFGASISHMEMEPIEAEKLAHLLTKHAHIARVPHVGNEPDHRPQRIGDSH